MNNFEMVCPEMSCLEMVFVKALTELESMRRNCENDSH